MRSICFYVWNEYQLACFESVIRLVGGYVAVEDRGYNTDFVLSVEQEYKESGKFLRLNRGEAAKELDHFDLVVAHTVFEGVGALTSVKLAFVQYGLAKEDYNYGLWRGLADVNYTFGEYSKQKIAGLSNAIVVGHSVLSSLRKQRIDAVVCESKSPTVFYAPTWGEHSSLEVNLERLEALSRHFQLVVAPHHNTIVFNPELIKKIPQTVELVLDQKSRVDWLVRSDLVVSDLSGIIFDAFYLRKKVVVLREGEFAKASEKIGCNSIENRKINKFAAVVGTISSLPLLRDSCFPEYEHDAEYYQLLISDTFEADERLADELIKLEFCDRYPELREKIRAHWKAIDNQRIRIRAGSLPRKSSIGQRISRFLWRGKEWL